jgi:hypothetical protein
MKKACCLFLLFCMLASCHGQKEPLPGYITTNGQSFTIDYAPPYRQEMFAPVLDSVVIPLPRMKNEKKPLLSIKGNRLLVATPKGENAYVIDLETNRVVQTYRIKAPEKETFVPVNPDIGCKCPVELSKDLQSADFYTEGKLLLQYEGKLKVIDTTGTVTDSMLLNTGNLKKDRFLYSNVYEVPVRYNDALKTVSVFRSCYMCPLRSRKFYEQSIIAQADLQTKTVRALPVFYPEIYRAFRLGFAEMVYGSVAGNELVLSFFPDSRIYTYNLQSGEAKVHAGKSQHSQAPVRILTKEENENESALLMHLMQTEQYMQVVYDASVQRYYRLFSVPLDGVHRESWYQVFDANFTLLAEVPVTKYSVFYEAYGGGLVWAALREGSVVVYRLAFRV